jgi:hypothetical protein
MVPPLPDAVRGRPLRLFLVEVFAQGVGECRAYRPFTSIKNMVFATGLTAIRSATGVVCPDVNATSYPGLRSSLATANCAEVPSRSKIRSPEPARPKTSMTIDNLGR